MGGRRRGWEGYGRRGRVRGYRSLLRKKQYSIERGNTTYKRKRRALNRKWRGKPPSILEVH